MAEKIKVPAGVYDMVTRCMEQEFPDNVAIRYVDEDGKTVVELDKLNEVYKVNGVDVLAKIKEMC